MDACQRHAGDERAGRGCSSMVEPQPSKLVMRVRFPSPAPARPRRARGALGRAGTPYTRTTSGVGKQGHGQGEVRAEQAALQHRDDRSRGPWQDVADGGDHEGAGEDGRRDVHGVRPDRQGAGGEGARDHDLDGACRVRDGEPALRACRLPGPRGLREEHDHGCGADGRRDPGGVGGGRPDAADARAHPAGAAGGRSGAGGVPEQDGHGGRPGPAGAGGDGGARAAVVLPVPGRRHPGDQGLGAVRRWRTRAGDRRAGDPEADGGGGRLHPAAGARDGPVRS